MGCWICSPVAAAPRRRSGGRRSVPTAGSASPPVITASIPALWSTWRGSRRRPNWAPTRSAAPPTNTSTRSTRTIARLQLAPEVLARVSPPLRAAEEYTSHPEIVFYTGCNVIKTPHIALLVLEVLDALGVSYEVMGGTAACCGIQQFKRGDVKTAGRVSYNTIDSAEP